MRIEGCLRRKLFVVTCCFFACGVVCAAAYGATSVSPENQQLIKDVLRSIGVPCVEQIGIESRAIGGAGVRLVLPQRITFFLNEEWFNSLGDAGKRFVIGHEAGHLKRWHGQKTIAAMLAGAFVTVGAFWSGGAKVGFPTLAAWLVFLCWYSRRMGLEADRDAALHSPAIAQAGIDAMCLCQRYEQDENPSLARRFDRALFHFSHPPFERRIKALEPMLHNPGDR